MDDEDRKTKGVTKGISMSVNVFSIKANPAGFSESLLPAHLFSLLFSSLFLFSPFRLLQCFSFAASHHTPSFFSDERVTKASRAETCVNTTQSVAVTGQKTVSRRLVLFPSDKRRREEKSARIVNPERDRPIRRRRQAWTANEADKHQARSALARQRPHGSIDARLWRPSRMHRGRLAYDPPVQGVPQIMSRGRLDCYPVPTSVTRNGSKLQC